MKILSLILKNLNSLRGEVAIDFQKPPFSTTGLFAITGPTGSGKTTLLDAITLALFGRAARYEGKKNPVEVMSRRTHECRAEVTFSCTKGTYRATWSLQRSYKKADGEIQPPVRRLIDVTRESVIAQKNQEVEERVIELTGLDYNQFLRSVLLSQGSFSRFLMAGPSERTSLLESITGAEIYRELSKSCFERRKNAEAQRETLRQQLAELKAFTDEERQLKTTQLATFRDKEKVLSQELADLERRLAFSREWGKLVDEEKTLRVAQEKLEQSLNRFKPDLERLNQHLKAVPFTVDLSRLSEREVQLKRQEEALRVDEAHLVSLRETVFKADSEAQLASSEWEDFQKFCLTQKPVWERVEELDRLIAVSRAELSQIQQSLKDENQKLAKNQLLQKENDRKITDSERSLSTLEAQLREASADASLAEKRPLLETLRERWAAGHEEFEKSSREWESKKKSTSELESGIALKRSTIQGIQLRVDSVHRRIEDIRADKALPPATVSLEQIRLQLDTARERCRTLEHTHQGALQLKETQNAIKQLEGERERLDKSITEAILKLENAKKQATRNEELLDKNQELLALTKTIQDLEGQRSHLVEGKPCPLCGSLSHPFVVHSSLPANSRIKSLEEQITSGKRQVAADRKSLNALVQLEASLKAEMQSCLKSLTEKRETLQKIQEWINQSALALGLPEVASKPDTLALHWQEALKIQTAQEALFKACHSRDEALKKASEDLQSLAAEHNAAKLALSGDEGKLQELSLSVNDLQARTSRFADQLQRARSEFCSRLPEAYPFQGTLKEASAFIEQLKKREKAYQQNLLERQKIQEELTLQKNTQKNTLDQLLQNTASLNALREREKGSAERFAHYTQERKALIGDEPLSEVRKKTDIKRDQLAEKQRKKLEKRDQERSRLDQRQAAFLKSKQDSDELKDSRSQLETALASVAERLGFSSLPLLRAALLSTDTASQLEESKRRLDRQVHESEVASQSIAKRRSELPPEAREDFEKSSERESLHKSLQEAKNSLLLETGALQQALEADSQVRQRALALEAQRAKAETEFIRWSRLNELIGSATGDRFARFAQSLTLRRLTELANRHFSVLNPRYSLRAAPGEVENLELEIVDHYQADSVRPTRSLSGGETFLASLALALGLSDLSSGGNTIQSLFIDEGFGTLDQRTLESVMDALDNLQATGKTIGVISHITSMQERIPVQIKVVRQTGGVSRVELP